MAGPVKPLTAPLPNTFGCGTQSSVPIPESPATELIAAMPSAPPCLAYRAGTVMSVMLGVIFATSGIEQDRRQVSVNFCTRSWHWPTLAPEPSTVMCGQDTLISSMSAPASAQALERSAHSWLENPMMLAMTRRSGQCFLRYMISSRLAFSPRSEVCSTFWTPICRLPPGW